MKDFLNKSSVVTQEMFFYFGQCFLSSEQALEIAEAPENGPDTKPPKKGALYGAGGAPHSARGAPQSARRTAQSARRGSYSAWGGPHQP